MLKDMAEGGRYVLGKTQYDYSTSEKPKASAGKNYKRQDRKN